MGIEREGDLRFQYNAMTERESRLGIQFYETPFRSYDAQLGRFHQVDLLAGLYTGISPYNYALNNPISFNDPTGLAPSAWEVIQHAWNNTPDGENRHFDFSNTNWEDGSWSSNTGSQLIITSYGGGWIQGYTVTTTYLNEHDPAKYREITTYTPITIYGGEGEKVRRFGDGLVKKHDVECPICKKDACMHTSAEKTMASGSVILLGGMTTKAPTPQAKATLAVFTGVAIGASYLYYWWNNDKVSEGDETIPWALPREPDKNDSRIFHHYTSKENFDAIMSSGSLMGSLNINPDKKGFVYLTDAGFLTPSDVFRILFEGIGKRHENKGKYLISMKLTPQQISGLRFNIGPPEEYVHRGVLTVFVVNILYAGPNPNKE